MNKLKGLPFYSLRVGQYRVIIVIGAKKLVVLVLDIALKNKAYKKP